MLSLSQQQEEDERGDKKDNSEQPNRIQSKHQDQEWRIEMNRDKSRVHQMNFIFRKTEEAQRFIDSIPEMSRATGVQLLGSVKRRNDWGEQEILLEYMADPKLVNVNKVHNKLREYQRGILAGFVI